MKKIFSYALTIFMAFTMCANANAKSTKEIAFQMYSVRDLIGDPGKYAKNHEDVLKKLAAMGYTAIEAACYGDGKLYGITPEQFKSDIEAAGMKVLSSHVGHNLNDEELSSGNIDGALNWWKQCIDAHKAAGMKYLVNPGVNFPRNLKEAKVICNYLNKPANKVLIEQRLMSWTTFMHEQMPHVHRHGGNFSLSQITMDDVDLTRKLKDTKQRVHAYYAYDVVSQCVVGASYARKKDEGLVVDCFRDMFRLIEKQGWGMPAGIEVENHLMTQYKDGFLQAGVAFPFVHFCAPQNSQEKYAEPLNGAKKRSVIHKNHEGIGRFYGKGKWRQEYKKVSDETNELYEDKEYFSWDQLVAEDRRDSYEWNHQLHPNQKKFPGMTRWDVLCERINPTLQPLDKLTLARYIGERVETSIRRNSTVRVAHEDWWLSDTSVLEKLRPNDYQVTAYYMPDEEGKPTEVYIFQGDKYIDHVEKVQTYNRVMAEQTEEDTVNYIEQRKKIAKFSKYVKDHAIDEVGILKPSATPQQAEAVALEPQIKEEQPVISQWKPDPIADI